MASEEVEHLNGAGEVPFAGRGLKGEAAALEDIAKFGDGSRRLLRQADAKPLHRTVDPRTVFAAEFLGAHFLFFGSFVDRFTAGGSLRCRRRFVQVFVDLIELIPVPLQRGFGRIGHAENL